MTESGGHTDFGRHTRSIRSQASVEYRLQTEVMNQVRTYRLVQVIKGMDATPLFVQFHATARHENGVDRHPVFTQNIATLAGRCRHMHIEARTAGSLRQGHSIRVKRIERIVDKQQSQRSLHGVLSAGSSLGFYGVVKHKTLLPNSI
jgi:hypothetical protein